MKFYIDFDHTLYNTNDLTNAMLNSTAEYILNNGNFEQFPENFKKKYPNLEPITIERNIKSITDLLVANFKRPEETTLKIDYNIFALINTFGNLFNCDCEKMKQIINQTLDNGESYRYGDAFSFLKYLKEQGHETYILSEDRFDLAFQRKKIEGSGILKPNLVDAAILTKVSKASLDEVLLQNTNVTSIIPTDTTKSIPKSIDYKHGIFVDDKPKDLRNLHNRCYANLYPPYKTRLYRIRRPKQTYSTQSLEAYGIQTVTSLDKLQEILSAEQQASQSGERKINL